MEEIEKGFGVVLDDFVAGIYANICVHLAVYFGVVEFLNREL